MPTVAEEIYSRGLAAESDDLFSHRSSYLYSRRTPEHSQATTSDTPQIPAITPRFIGNPLFRYVTADYAILINALASNYSELDSANYLYNALIANNLVLSTYQIESANKYPSTELQRFLTGLRLAVKLEAMGDTDGALDYIYRVFYDECRLKHFDLISAVLATDDTRNLATDLLLGVITITRNYRRHLPSRKQLCIDSRAILSARGEDADTLLKFLDI